MMIPSQHFDCPTCIPECCQMVCHALVLPPPCTTLHSSRTCKTKYKRKWKYHAHQTKSLTCNQNQSNANAMRMSTYTLTRPLHDVSTMLPQNQHRSGRFLLYLARNMWTGQELILNSCD
ncbi:unnamed protein product [Amoebophrya sp. A120]|nr:unnamed protein product [Amoebophrya sp. A120]|eukprot:GSA120T00000731001.1